jgi:hypothetical protein
MTWVGTAISKEEMKRTIAAVKFMLRIRLAEVDKVCDVCQSTIRNLGEGCSPPNVVFYTVGKVAGGSRGRRAQPYNKHLSCSTKSAMEVHVGLFVSFRVGISSKAAGCQSGEAWSCSLTVLGKTTLSIIHKDIMVHINNAYSHW